MKRKLSIVLVVLILINLLTSSLAVIYAQDVQQTEPKTLKVFAIGNSFSGDSMNYIYQIAKNLGAEEVVLGNMIIGGCDLKKHLQYATTNALEYKYAKNTKGSWVNIEDTTLIHGLQDEEWDYIILQQQSEQAADASTYNSDLDGLVSYVNKNKTNPDAKLVWNFTWSYRNGYAPSEYNKNQLTMYNAISNAVQTKIATNSNFSVIIPTGTAIQNARSSFVGDSLNRDSKHLSIPLGRFIASMMWVKSITGWNIDDVTYVPTSDITPQILAMVKESVNNAHITPYSVTTSSYTPTPEPPTVGERLTYFDFTGYTTVKEVTDEGWRFDNASAVSCDENGLQVGDGATNGTDGYLSFDSVTIKGEAGTACPIGKNAKITFEVKQVNLNAYNMTSYISINGNSLPVAGVSRSMTGTNSFCFGINGPTAIAGVTGSGKALASGNINNYKFEILISDANGKYLEKPVVNAYTSLYGTNAYVLMVENGDILSNVTTVDSLQIHASSATKNSKAVLTGCSVYLSAEIDANATPTPVPTPTQVPTPTPEVVPTQVPTQAPTQAPTAVPTSVPTQAPTMAPTVAPTQAPATSAPTQVPSPSGKEIVMLYSDDFEGKTQATTYTAHGAVNGWYVNAQSDASRLKIGTDSTDYLRLRTNAKDAYKKFDKAVAIKADSGLTDTDTSVATPGKNATVTVIFRCSALEAGPSNAKDLYWGVGTVANVTSKTATFGAGAVTNLKNLGGTEAFLYGKTATSYDETRLIVPNTNPVYAWTKIKLEIKITDADGEFLTGGPEIDTYYHNGTDWVAGAQNMQLVNDMTSLDCFILGTGNSSSYQGTDDIEVYLMRDKETEDAVYGDADANGEVAVEDATAILRYKAGLLGEADINLDNADADANGEVAVEDATAILRYKAGLLANLGPQA